MFNNPYIAVVIFISVIFIFSSFLYHGKKVTLKKKAMMKSTYIFPNILKFLQIKIPATKLYVDNLSESVALFTQRNRDTNEIYASNILTLYILGGLTITVLSIVIIPFIILKIIIPLLSVSVLIFIMNKIIENKRKKAQKDFPTVLHVFITQFVRTFSLNKTFKQSMAYIPSSHKYEFFRILISLGGGSKSDYIDVLNEYARRIKIDNCTAFVEILQAGMTKNDQLLSSLMDLQNRVSQENNSEIQKRNKLNDKKLNIIIAILASIGAVMINIYLLGSFAYNFYFNTFIGQILLITLSIFIVAIGIFINIVDKLL
jgi:hypothetical protein